MMRFDNRFRLGSRLSISGRVSVALLGVVLASAVAGTLLVSRRAVAQTPAAPPPAIDFGPAGMTERGNVGIGNITIKALYPKLGTNATQPFRVEAFTNYVTVSLDIPADTAQNIREIACFFAPDAHGKIRLWLQDLATGAYNGSPIVGTESDAYFVSPRIHPAIRSNGKAVYPLAAIESADDTETVTTEDGFVEYYSYIFEIPPAPKGGLGA